MASGRRKSRGVLGRRAGLVASGLVLALAAPTAASATITANVDGDVIRVEGGNEGNSIEVFYNLFTGELQFSDPAGVVGTATCPEGGGELQCPTTPTTARVSFETGGGEDTVEFLVSYTRFVGPFLATDFIGGPGNDTFSAFGRGTLDGGPGADRLLGGDHGDAGNRIRGGGGKDRLTDNEGSDKLFGEGGADVLVGGDDRDRYSGGAGKDLIRAKDFTKDLGIDCGSGRDRLRSDPFDPKPKSC